MVTFNPLATSRRPREAQIMPLPSDDVTPPVTKIYFVVMKTFSGEWIGKIGFTQAFLQVKKPHFAIFVLPE